MPLVPPAELTAFRAGQPEALRTVYREYAGLVYSVALRAIGTRELAEDVTQQTFVKAWRSSSSFDPQRALGPWLATIARRTAIDTHRREARRRTEPLDAGQRADPTVADPLSALARRDEAAEVRAAIDRLPWDECEIIRLQHLRGLSHQDIADHLGLPLGTVKSRSHRAHGRLAVMLGHLRGGPN